MKTVWVVCWRYVDCSAMGVVRVYEREREARQMLEFLAKHGDTGKVFFFEEAEYRECYA